MNPSVVAPTAIAAVLCLACSAGSEDTPNSNPDIAQMTPPDDIVAPGVDEVTDSLLAPPAEEDGFQVSLEPFEVEPGEEAYYCYRMPMPVDHDFELAVVESRFSAGAHHLLLSTVDVAYEPAQGHCTAGDFGFEVPINEAIQNNLRFLSGTQTPYADDPRTRLEFEEGMAFQVSADATLLAQLHWVNTTTEVQNATTAINLLYPKTETTMPLESFFFFHTEIALPPQELSEVAGRCTFPEGLQIVSMVSHMHSRGIDFTAHRTGAVEELLYREDSWAEPQMKFWPSNDLLQLAPGETIDYRCFFDNDTPSWIYTGESAGEEMCMLIGLYTGGTGTIWGFPGVDYPGNACTTVP